MLLTIDTATKQLNRHPDVDITFLLNKPQAKTKKEKNSQEEGNFREARLKQELVHFSNHIRTASSFQGNVDNACSNAR